MGVRIRQLEVHLTHRCNLRCRYCYAAEPGARLPGDLTPALADAAVDFLFDHALGKRLRLDLWGGEPLLRLDLIERMAARARRLEQESGCSLRIGVPTNVTLLDERAVSVVRAWDIHLSLSLDGTPEAHAHRRTPDGRNGWRLIEPRLRALVDAWEGALPTVRMTVVPERASRLEEDLGYLLQLGFRRIAFLPASGAGWDDTTTTQLDASLGRVADQWASSVRSGSADIPSYPHLLRRIVPLWFTGRGGVLPHRRGVCGAGETLLAVDTLGDLYPCHRVVGVPTPPADLRLGSLSEGVTNHALRASIAALGADAGHVRCASCEHRPLCGTLCLALNHRITGNLQEVPDEACFVMDRLRYAAVRFHEGLVGHRVYDDMMQSYLASDPDDRFLPLLSCLEQEEETDAMIEDIEAALASTTGSRKP